MLYLGLADFLIVAERVLAVPADQLARLERIDLADSALSAPQAGFGGVDFYPELEQKAAILCSRLLRNHPLLDGNKRVAYLCMLEFLERNGVNTDAFATLETAEVIEAVAAREMTEEDFVVWVRTKLDRS